MFKRREVITYVQNERQQKTSQNYPYWLFNLDRREAGIYRIFDCWDCIHTESDWGAEEYTEREEAKKVEAESVVKRLSASGMSADEILEKRL